MALLDKTKEFCRQYGITPARSKGQNFLVNDDIYDKIVESADLQPDDIVLEVGPGLGFLTAKLSRKAKQVIAVELDDKLADFLKTGLLAQNIKNVAVVNENILDLPCHSRAGGNPESEIKKRQNIFWIPDRVGDDEKDYKIVANLPYNITSVFLRKFLTAENKPSLMVLMLQKEVAERITAKPGKMSLLAVSAQFYAQIEIMEIVPKENFWPQPEVDSAIVKITVYPGLSLRGAEQQSNFNAIFTNQRLPRPRGARNGKNKKTDVSVDKERDFFRMVKFGFSSRRKMLKNNLAGGYHIEQKIIENLLKSANLNPMIRAQDLGLEDWKRLFDINRQNML